MHLHAAKSIDQLNFQDRFVRSLPGDRERGLQTRSVLGACYSAVEPSPVRAPELLVVVPEVAALLDLSPEATPELAEVLAGNRVLPGMAPYAACYGGHQFGNWAGQLGDGRAITLGEVENARGESWELQLKGAGPTPYSRHADGRAVLRSSLRELVCSEAMFHLGVPTTRALSLALTGESVVRDLLYDGHPEAEPGAVVCRVAPTFLRFGSYEIHAARKDFDTLQRLVQFTLERHYPQHLRGGVPQIDGFLEEVCRRTARLMIEWMRVGFVHGVMNTDNMSIVGLTIDYGPYGWLDVFDLDWTPNITDAATRRYRFGNQLGIAHWNLVQLARALAPLVEDVEPLKQALEAYAQELAVEQRRMLLGKLGLRPRAETSAQDDELLSSLFAILSLVETDMTLFFRRLADLPLPAAGVSAESSWPALRDAYYAPDAVGPAERSRIAGWLERYFERARAEGSDDATRRTRMNAVNPLYVPRNFLVQEVIDQTQAGDRRALPELLEVLRRPYELQPGRERFAAKRPEWARHKPGCSMLSCSS